MASDVRIAIIGAGSATFSAEIVRDLCVTEGLHGSHVVFMDVDAHRMEMVGRLAERLSNELGAGLTFSRTTSREEALRGADFVINTAQVGGHAWTEAQRELAEQHGYYRGIGLHNIGQAAFFLEVARDIVRLCPRAWLLQSANPVFEGCTLMTRETPVQAIGLCHGHYHVYDMARTLGLDPKRVSFRAVGFNHWIWLTEFRYDGEDAYLLLDRWIETEAEAYWAADNLDFMHNQMRRATIQLYKIHGLMPIGDTPRTAGWWQHTDLATKLRWFGPTGGFDSEIGWGQYLEQIARRVERIEEAARDESRPITETFAPVRSGEQIVPIIDALVHDRPGTFQVNVPNHGPLLQGFPEDLVVEVQAVVDGGGVHPMAEPPLSPKLMAGAMIPRWQRAELLVRALQEHDRDLLLLYLLGDHRTRSLDQAEGLLKAWLDDPRNARMAEWFGQGRGD